MPSTKSFEHGIPCWVDLVSTDIDAAKEFYTGLFGWEYNGMESPMGVTYWGASLKGAGVAGLAAQPSDMAAQGLPSSWNTYIAVDDVDETTARAEGAGGSVIQAPMDISDFGRMSFILDPAGAAVGMWQAVKPGERLVKEHGALIWNEVYAPDADATVAFYGEVFGWTTGRMPMPDGSNYTTFEVGGEAVAGTTTPPMEEVPPHWHVWFGSDDTEATAKTAAELGATVVIDPTDSPIGKIGSFRDPVGAAFSVIAPNSPT